MMKHCLVALVVLGSGAVFGLLSEDPCDVTVWPGDNDPDVIDKTVPSDCVNGTFLWDYPRKTVHLHFPNPSGTNMAVCIRDDILGNIFTVRDITHALGFPMVIGEKESCTPKHHSKITLRIDAPEQLYYMAAIYYYVYVD